MKNLFDSSWSQLDFHPIDVFAAFHNIPLDIEGSNLQNIEWHPGDICSEYMSEDDYRFQIELYRKSGEKVLFSNVDLIWDHQDGDYCIGHSFVYEIKIINNKEGDVRKVEYEDGDRLFFNGDGTYYLPVSGVTIYDFIRACEMCEINLQLTPIAISIIKRVQ